MRYCSGCMKIAQLLYGRMEEKSGPGAISGTYRCGICWQGFDVRVDHPHNVNFGDKAFEIIRDVRMVLGVTVPCERCQQDEDLAAGRAIKTVIVFHNCGKSEEAMR